MKKKGFTLVELLAVITILSIILVIVAYNVMKAYSSRTDMDYDNVKKIIVESARTMIESSYTMSDKVDKAINTSGNTSNACILDYEILVNNNYIDADTKNPKTNSAMNGYVKITLNRTNYKYSYEFIDTITGSDAQIPRCMSIEVTSAITFNAAGGTGGQSSTVMATNGEDMPSINTIPPTRSGYIFKGWFDAETGGTQYYSAQGESVRTWDKTNNNTTLYARWSNVICRKATNDEIHSNNNAVYGQVGGAGLLNPGDAFVCDVNADDEYNAQTEMFYYVSDYYVMAVGAASSFDSNYATLIYSNDTYNGTINNTASAPYFKSKTNLQGPVDARRHLPTTSQWPGVSLYYTTRYLHYSDAGYYKDFSYEGYAARLLTYNELLQGCPSFNPNGTASLSNCRYLLENGYYKGYVWGYWLETAELGTSSNINKRAKGVLIGNGTNGGRVATLDVDTSSNYGVRPVIDVKKTYISY